MKKEFLMAVSLLAGTIIGAGIFTLPYFFNLLGFFWGIVYLLFFMLFYYFIHLMYVRVLALETGEHQFFYLIKKYFSLEKSKLMSIFIFFELTFVMLVYLILAPTFLNLILPIDLKWLVIIFWFFSSLFIFLRVSILSFADLLGILSMLLIIFILFFSNFNFVFKIDFFKEIKDYKILLLPFGPMLFSFAGRPALHKVIEIFKLKKNFSLKKAVFFGMFLTFFVYLFFVISVLKITPNVSPETLNSLNHLPQYLIKLLAFLGVITLWTSYFMIGLNIKDILILDLKVSKILSSLIVLLLPLFFYFLGFNNFLRTISFVGGIFLAVEGLIIIRLWQKAFSKSKYYLWSYILYFIFVFAIIYEAIFFFGL